MMHFNNTSLIESRYGLIGSTAWGELNADYLQKRVIAYVNTDVGKFI